MVFIIADVFIFPLHGFEKVELNAILLIRPAIILLSRGLIFAIEISPRLLVDIVESQFGEVCSAKITGSLSSNSADTLPRYHLCENIMSQANSQQTALFSLS